MIITRIKIEVQLQGVHVSNVNPESFMFGYGGEYGGQVANEIPGRLGNHILRCTTIISDLYQDYSEVELANSQKDPQPPKGKCLRKKILCFDYLLLFIQCKCHTIIHKAS